MFGDLSKIFDDVKYDEQCHQGDPWPDINISQRGDPWPDTIIMQMLKTIIM